MKIKLLSSAVVVLALALPSLAKADHLKAQANPLDLALFDGYRAVQVALSKDDLSQAKTAADLLGQSVQKFYARFLGRHSRSFTVGNPPRATGNVPVTSTLTRVPGRDFVMKGLP